MNQYAILDPEQLRQAMRAWSSGVTIVTASHEGDSHGMTVSSFTSIALEPPMIIISLQTNSRTHKIIMQAKAFAVTILADGQEEISNLFAGRNSAAEDRFANIETEALVTGAPFIKGGLAYLDCRLNQEIAVGTNTLFLAEVVAAQANGGGKPLVYHDRKYRKLVD